jgi:hypothetical protein
MDLAIKNIIYDLLQFRRATTEATSIFAGLKHNANLCPKFQRKLESAFDAFDKYHRITYDIQGPQDQGSDVLVRQVFHEQAYFICFQIKSQDDLRENTWLKSIKAQWFDSEKSYHNLLDYYILLCCDTGDSATKSKVRVLECEFSRAPLVHVIEPEYVISFLRLSLVQMDAIIKAKLGSEDIVFRNGLSIASDFTPTENAVLLYLIYQRIYQGAESTDEEAVLNSEFIQYVYANTPDFDRDWFFEDEEEVDEDFHREYIMRQLDIRERLSFDLEALKDLYVRTRGSGISHVSLCEVQPLVVLMMDGNERYGYMSDDLLFYMMDLFGPYKGYVPPQDDAALS